MRNKCILPIEFIFQVDSLEVVGNVALIYDKHVSLPMTDEDILEEVKVQYGYDAIKVLHKQREKV